MSNFSSTGSTMKPGTVMLLKDVVVPERFYNRIKTMSPVLDQIFGDQELPGIMPGSPVLFTGTPGAGKSTTTLQLMEHWALNGHSVLYNVGEENEYQVKYRATKLGLAGLFPISKFDEVDDLVQYVIENKVEILVQDSLQSLDSDDLDGVRLLRHIVERLTWLAKEHGVTVFMIGHVTKGGMASGPQKIFHDVDVHAHLSLNKDTGGRIFELKKNRFGPSCVPYEFMMGADGLQFKEISQDPSLTKASMRKEKAMEVVKSLLLRGKKLSGYSHEEEPEIRDLEITGGFMRAILRMACKELEAEGSVIGTETINRREHFFVEV